MKTMCINFLLEENKFTSVKMKDAQEKLLKSLSSDKLFSLVLEKARSQGRETALEWIMMHKENKGVDFSYAKIRKK